VANRASHCLNAMPIDPAVLSALASDYAKGMTSIRGRRVQRLVKREFAGADKVIVVAIDSGVRGVLGSSASGAAFCATDGKGKHASVLKWLHGESDGIETRFDLLKDSMPALDSRTNVVPASVLRAAG
jgi:hypothetical protein